MNRTSGHTPAPWKVHGLPWEHNTEPRIWTQYVHTSVAGLGHRIAGHTQFQVEANARRIVACVNYCEGVSTGEIEAAPKHLKLKGLLSKIDSIGGAS